MVLAFKAGCFAVLEIWFGGRNEYRRGHPCSFSWTVLALLHIALFLSSFCLLGLLIFAKVWEFTGLNDYRNSGVGETARRGHRVQSL